jgi:lysyl endopeptidase
MKTKIVKHIKLSSSAALATGFFAILFTASTFAASLPKIDGEYAKPFAAAAKAAARLPLLGDASMQADFLAVTFQAMDAAQIDRVKKSNRVASENAISGGPMQIGIPRTLRDEFLPTSGAPDLRWKNLPGGGKVAYIRVTSIGAKALRVGLNATKVPAGLELRVAGIDRSNAVVSLSGARELTNLRDANGIYWTTMTEGQSQLIEISLPANLDVDAKSFEYTMYAVAHIFASPSLKFSDAKSFSDCNVDAVCTAQSEGFVNAKNSVAMMAFQGDDGQGGTTTASFTCTATLLNDNDASTQIPYLFSSSRCISTQSSANTLTTFWFFENPTCANPRSSDVNVNSGAIVGGGAAMLVADINGDGAFLRMNDSPPGGVFFLGWDAATAAAGEPISVLHHSLGDPKRLTLGVVDRFRNDLAGSLAGLTGSFISPTYTTGTTSSGSTGAGLLTTTDGKYFLRGALTGGPATCENRNTTVAGGNYAYYSRFDLIYPSIKRFLFKDITPPNYTDIWWGGPAESGWGIQITQHATGNIFGTWYTYDQAGNQLFVVMSGCDLIPFNGSVCSGRLYKTTGTPFNDANFGGATTTYIGNGTFTFTDADNAVFDYTIVASATNAQTTLQKKITRFPFGVGVAAFPNDASDIYFNPDAPGWGYSLAQHGTAAFGVIYHYDENRNPMFLTMYMPVFNANNGGATSATLYRTRSNGGSHYLSPTWRASDITNIPVAGSGNATASIFPGGVNLLFTITSGTTFAQQRALSKIPF